jgi:hypothetical protein
MSASAGGGGGGGQEEDKKPGGDQSAHINLKVKGQVFLFFSFLFFFLNSCGSVRVSMMKLVLL